MFYAFIRRADNFMCKGLKHPAVAVKQTPCQTLLDQDEASHCPSVFMGHCVYKGKAKYHLSPRALRSGPLAPEGVVSGETEPSWLIQLQRAQTTGEPSC